MRTFKLLVLAPFAIVAACGGDKPTPPVTPPTSMDTDAGGMPSDMPASSGTAALPSASAMPSASASAVPSTTSSAMMATAPDAGPADAGKATAKKDDKKPAAKK